MLTGRILLTGGSGTMGRAIIKRATEENWDCQIVIFSTDAMKHAKIKAQYPKVQSIIGDIRDFTTLSNAMVGCEYVLHLAAVKHIDFSEYNSIDTFEVNVTGSMNVCMAAMQLGIPHVLGISTDKAAHPANCYGATKMLMEKLMQEYSRLDIPTQFHLVRMGNVLESNGSVIEAWKRQIDAGKPIKITDPNMTRFWLSPSQAVDYIEFALSRQTGWSGWIYIPKLPALSIGKLAEYTVGEVDIERIEVRPGEKLHETLLTLEETYYVSAAPNGGRILNPTISPYGRVTCCKQDPITSDIAHQLTREELMALLEE
jgi:UDP-N-acetylglucosamine 4,6-dehydratase